MFQHTTASALQSLATQLLCSSLWLQPLDQAHAVARPHALPPALEALGRSIHRVLTLDPQDLDGLPGPSMDHLIELLLDHHDLPDSVCAVEAAADSLPPTRLMKLVAAANSQMVSGSPVRGRHLQAACRDLLRELPAEGSA